MVESLFFGTRFVKALVSVSSEILDSRVARTATLTGQENADEKALAKGA
jgi:hypothetical protein